MSTEKVTNTKTKKATVKNSISLIYGNQRSPINQNAKYIYQVKTKLPPVLVDVPVNTKLDPTC